MFGTILLHFVIMYLVGYDRTGLPTTDSSYLARVLRVLANGSSSSMCIALSSDLYMHASTAFVCVSARTA